MPERTTFEPSARRVIGDLASLKAISDPLRLRIVEELCDRERSVGEIADSLGTTRHRLYYHVRILEKLGLVVETSRRAVSGAEERLYRSAARSFVVSKQMSPAVLSGTLATVFGQTLREVEAAAARRRKPGSDPQVEVIRGVASLTAERRRDFQRRLKALVQEFEQPAGVDDTIGHRYGLLIAMAPVLEERGAQDGE